MSIPWFPSRCVKVAENSDIASPQTGSGFLVAQPLDKSTPKPRKWQKVKREIVGPYGVPFFVTVWEGGESGRICYSEDTTSSFRD